VADEPVYDHHAVSPSALDRQPTLLTNVLVLVKCENDMQSRSVDHMHCDTEHAVSLKHQQLCPQQSALLTHLSRPTLARRCNYTGPTDPASTVGWGVIDFDWSNWKGAGVGTLDHSWAHLCSCLRMALQWKRSILHATHSPLTHATHSPLTRCAMHRILAAPFHRLG
jgi:hypothetical protein